MASENRIHQLLAEAGIDWRQTMAAFIQREGITRCPWLDIDIVLASEGVRLLSGLMRPPEFHYSPQWAADQPPLEWFGMVFVAPDWSANFDSALDELGARLGRPAKDDNANSRGRIWRDGDAEVEIRGWPPELQFSSINFMHEREPRTKTACHLTIRTGFRPDCTAAEHALLQSFTEIATLPDRSGRVSERPRQYELEYFRSLPTDLRHLSGRIGRAGDRLAWARTDLHIVPLKEVKGVTLLRCRPARGHGGGSVELVCESSAAGGSEKSLSLGEHRRFDGLDAWAAALADALDRPLAVQELFDE